jgi:drug/metabolite transporter (DMT)-like permease
VLGIGILAVSSASILIRFAQREASSLVIAAYRLTISALILLPITLSRSRAALRRVTGQQMAWLAAAGLFLAIHFAAWITSLEMTTVFSSVVLVATTPLWVALVSPFFLNEKIPAAIWWGVGLSLAGSLAVAASGMCVIGGGLKCTLTPHLWTGQNLTGNLLALVGAWCAAGYMIIGRRVRPSLPLPVYTLGVYGSAALALLAMAAASGASFVGSKVAGQFQPFSALTWICIAGLAIGPQLLGHTSYNWALGYLPAASVSVALLGEPVGTTILAFIILREMPTMIELAGGILILAGIYITSRASIGLKNGQPVGG